MNNAEHGFPLVSVIMNCYNSEQYLHEAIQSVLAQTYQHLEIIFWDNASTDGSATIVHSYQDKRIRYFKGDALVPLYTARNLALERCQGDVIAFLDCDDIWLPQKLALQVALFQKGYPVVYGDQRVIDHDGHDCGQKQYPMHSGWVTHKLVKRNVISIGAMMLSAEVIQKYKFDSVYNLLGDFDLWVRLSTNYQFACVPEVLMLSRQHAVNLSSVLKKKWLPERRYFYRKMLKHYGVNMLPSMFVYICKTELKGFLGRY